MGNIPYEPVEKFKPQIDAVGATVVYQFHENGPIGASVVAQYSDASADLSVLFTGTEEEFLANFPPGTKLGAAVGELSLVVEGVPYGTELGNWYMPSGDNLPPTV